MLNEGEEEVNEETIENEFKAIFEEDPKLRELLGSSDAINKL